MVCSLPRHRSSLRGYDGVWPSSHSRPCHLSSLRGYDGEVWPSSHTHSLPCHRSSLLLGYDGGSSFSGLAGGGALLRLSQAPVFALEPSVGSSGLSSCADSLAQSCTLQLFHHSWASSIASFSCWWLLSKAAPAVTGAAHSFKEARSSPEWLASASRVATDARADLDVWRGLRRFLGLCAGPLTPLCSSPLLQWW